MTRKSKNFGGSTPPQGVPSIDVNIYHETFKVRGAMSGLRLLKVMKAIDGQGGDDESGVGATEVILKFLSDAFLEEDRERAMKFLDEYDEPPIGLTLLTEIIQWLVEQYTGNPTEQPENSEPTSEVAGSGSTATASSPAAPTSAVLTDTSSLPSQPPTQPAAL